MWRVGDNAFIDTGYLKRETKAAERLIKSVRSIMNRRCR